MWLSGWGDPGRLKPIDRFMITESDIITFHNYSNADSLRRSITQLRQYGRPMLCTEYMARPAGSTFEDVMPVLRENKVGAYHWGFVTGKQ